MKRATMWAGTVAVLAESGGSVVLREFVHPAQTTTTHRTTAAPVSTAPIQRGDLSENSQLSGTLGFRREQKSTPPSPA
jgi:hypothetical protein